ncbi:bifunctional diguanylate cyclase/phosphodiesterase [Roseibium hamelinense]|nr:bifunctional diguanylate cyclase/phosphodiesterase [Roseibium hamelinense]
MSLFSSLTAESARKLQSALVAALGGAHTHVEGGVYFTNGSLMASELFCEPLEFKVGTERVVLLQVDWPRHETVKRAPYLPPERLLSHFPDEVLVFEADEELGAIQNKLEFVIGTPIDGSELENAIQNCRQKGPATLHVRSEFPQKLTGGASGQTTEVRLVHMASETEASSHIMAVLRQNVDAPDEVEEYKRLANLDPLTDLLNRRAFLGALDRQLEAMRADAGNGLGVFYIDLDEFKKVNDFGGHDAGDTMLRLVGSALDSILPEHGAAGRIGGDEFACFLSLVDSEECALAKAQEFLDALLNIRLNVDDRVFTIGGSIGVALVRELDVSSKTTASGVLKFADEACLCGKRSGGRSISIRIFEDSGNNQKSPHADAPEPDRLRAQDLSLYAMPVIWLGTRRPFAQEILLRVKVTASASISPRALLSAAARNRYISKVDSWILDKVLDAADEERGRSWLTVNVSAESARDEHFCDVLKMRLETNPLLAARICLEISERDFLREPASIEAFFKLATELGCQTAIDDFGGHWPVLSRLTELKVDWIKLDPSLTGPALSNEAKAKILASLVQTTHDLNIRLIAKHVETQEQADQLSEIGIDAGQGHYFGRAIPWPGAGNRNVPKSIT